MRQNAAYLLLLLIHIATRAAGDCQVQLVHTLLGAWGDNPPYSAWNVQLIATTQVTSLQLQFDSPSSLDQVWEMTSEGSGLYTLPASVASNGGIKPGSPHTFGYIIRSSEHAAISTSTAICLDTPTPSPTSTPISTPTPASDATTAPINYDKVCDVVLIVDNYVVRTGSNNLAYFRQKYTAYFNDVDLFYQKNFNMKMNLLYMHFEEGAPFSATINDGELLDSFRSALLGGYFGTEVPTSACSYHLITGRNIPGVGGLAWIGTACDGSLFNTGFSVDVQSQDDPFYVVRRMTHELGHSFGGQHFDFYSQNSLYSCDAGISRETERLLKRSVQASIYKYMDDSVFISDCATATMKSSIPSFPCLWGATSNTGLPSMTLYEGQNFSGTSTAIYARNGVISSQCYNIVYPYGSTLSSFKLSGNVRGIRFFESQDCVGQAHEFVATSATYVGDSADRKANSFQFLL